MDFCFVSVRKPLGCYGSQMTCSLIQCYRDAAMHLKALIHGHRDMWLLQGITTNDQRPTNDHPPIRAPPPHSQILKFWTQRSNAADTCRPFLFLFLFNITFGYSVSHLVRINLTDLFLRLKFEWYPIDFSYALNHIHCKPLRTPPKQNSTPIIPKIALGFEDRDGGRIQSLSVFFSWHHMIASQF